MGRRGGVQELVDEGTVAKGLKLRVLFVGVKSGRPHCVGTRLRSMQFEEGMRDESTQKARDVP